MLLLRCARTMAYGEVQGDARKKGALMQAPFLYLDGL